MHVTVDDLLRDPPAMHGVADDPRLYCLNADALRFIEATVGPGQSTLETGSGLSTIVLASSAAAHTCVVPNAEQVARITAYCHRQGMALDHVTFEIDCSEKVLPRLDMTPLDLVLLDGSHSFPQVFIDWFFVAERLVVGGHIVIDDIHLWTGKVLRDFLKAEPGWALVSVLGGRTAVFRKDEGVDVGRAWTRQPYVATRSRWAVIPKARIVGATLRGGDLAEVGRIARRVVKGR
jgi:hypothetical protein